MSENWRKYDTAPENVLILIKCEWYDNPQKTIVVEALRQEDGVHFEDGFGLNYLVVKTIQFQRTAIRGAGHPALQALVHQYPNGTCPRGQADLSDDPPRSAG